VVVVPIVVVVSVVSVVSPVVMTVVMTVVMIMIAMLVPSRGRWSWPPAYRRPRGWRIDRRRRRLVVPASMPRRWPPRPKSAPPDQHD
jgi:hypothetical protein